MYVHHPDLWMTMSLMTNWENIGGPYHFSLRMSSFLELSWVLHSKRALDVQFYLSTRFLGISVPKRREGLDSCSMRAEIYSCFVRDLFPISKRPVNIEQTLKRSLLNEPLSFVAY